MVALMVGSQQLESELPLQRACAEEALTIYGERLMSSRKVKPFSSDLVRKVVACPEVFRAKQSPATVVTQQDVPQQDVQAKRALESGDGLMLCRSCRLPVGEVAYAYNDQAGLLVHGECMAQLLLQEVRQEDEQRLEEDADAKKEKRSAFDIGWKVDRVPKNSAFSKKFECPEVLDGPVCVVVEPDNGVHLAATCEPAASVNLGYLATALEVRRRDGREPLFSLDPCPDNSKMQRKRFEPAWLANTSVGEVMFQADIHLKELSMGEHEQPVAGMKSCLDFASIGSAWEGQSWNAREWYVVKKAEVQLSEDDVLIPQVSMGVEAREQTTQIDEDGLLEDKKITSAGHPLVRYAEAFTHHFDLIAERKSVVHHLRELAKASVLAKYFVDNEILLMESWFNGEEQLDCIMQVPQLWNERSDTHINVKDGQILGGAGATETVMRGIYGGVSFGLDSVSMKPAGAVLAVRTHIDRGSKLRVQAGRLAEDTISKYAHRMAIAKRGLVASRAAPTAAAAVSRAAAISAVSAAAPRGVDLNLNEFDLTSAGAWAGGHAQAYAVCDPVAGAFWAAIHYKQPSAICDEDRELFQTVFNPCCSDRREDGDRFAPPDTTPGHMAKLRALIQEEEKVQAERRARFFHAGLRPEDAGNTFPFSWASALAAAGVGRAALHARPEYFAAAAEALRGMPAAFDKATEDGTRFRVYKTGSLEIRTAQTYNSEEAVGAVFSTAAAAGASGVLVSDAAAAVAVPDGEKITKVTEYVEAISQAPFRHSFVELQTQQGNVVVTERSSDGRVLWTESPKNLEVRRCVAKVVRSVECNISATTVGDMRWFQEKDSWGDAGAYAAGAFAWASGAGLRAEPGFRCLPKLSEQGGASAAARAPVKLHSELRDSLSQKVNVAKAPAVAEAAPTVAMARCMQCGVACQATAAAEEQYCNQCWDAWERGVDVSLD